MPQCPGPPGRVGHAWPARDYTALLRNGCDNKKHCRGTRPVQVLPRGGLSSTGARKLTVAKTLDGAIRQVEQAGLCGRRERGADRAASPLVEHLFSSLCISI